LGKKKNVVSLVELKDKNTFETIWELDLKLLDGRLLKQTYHHFDDSPKGTEVKFISIKQTNEHLCVLFKHNVYYIQLYDVNTRKLLKESKIEPTDGPNCVFVDFDFIDGNKIILISNENNNRNTYISYTIQILDFNFKKSKELTIKDKKAKNCYIRNKKVYVVLENFGIDIFG